MSDVEVATGANLTEAHYPRRLFDGVQTRLICSCGWAGNWYDRKEDAELQWGAHGVKTIKRNANRRSFAIIGNPLAKGDKN